MFDKLKLNNKQEIYYYDNQVLSKKTLVFLHGWGQEHACFLKIIEKFSDTHCVAIDFPGFGKSQEPEEVYGVGDYARDIEIFFEQKNLNNIVIIAHSFGARVSIYLANGRQKHRIKKLLLTGAAGIKPKRTLTYRLKVMSYKFKKVLVKTPLYFQYKEDLLKTSGSFDYQNASEKMKPILIKVVNEDLTPRLKDIDMPVHLFWGKNDEATPLDDAHKMKENLSNSTLTVVEGTHYAFLEKMEPFINEIRKII